MKLSRSRMGLSLRTLVTTVLASAAILVPAGVAGAADPGAPVMTDITVTGSSLPKGGTALVSYTAESLSPLTSVSFRYVTPGNGLTVATRSPQLTGTLSATVPLDHPAGQYKLSEVTLQDSAGNLIRYYRGGATVRYPGNTAGTHTLPMAAMDLTVGYRPFAPSIEDVRVGSGNAVVFWGAPPSDGTPVQQYTITSQPGGRTVTTSGSADKVEFRGLTNSTPYRFTVRATNVFGTGPDCAPSPAVTPTMSTSILTPGDFSGDGRNDLIGVRFTGERMLDNRAASLYRGNGLGAFSGTTALNHPYSPQDLIVFSPGDFDGNGTSDVLVVGDNGWLSLEPGNGRGGFTAQPGGRKNIGPGWGDMTKVFGAHDFSGDGRNDVLAIRKSGGLVLYRGNGRGGFGSAGQQIGTGWASFLTVFSGGDFNGDGKNDVLAVSKDGGLYLYRGNGRGGFAAAGQQIGHGWGSSLSVFSPGDFSGDHKTDVMAVDAAGDLVLYRGNSRGGFAAAGQKIGHGWDAFR